MYRWSIVVFLAALACNGADDDTSMDTEDTEETGETDDTDLPDSDGDGVTDDIDCNDNNDDVYPGADELCNGLDDDCNDIADDDPVDALTFYEDADGDGFGDPDSPVQACAIDDGLSENDEDCDPANADIHPDAEDAPCDGIDNDCDTVIDPNNTLITDDESLQTAIDNAPDGEALCLAEGIYSNGAYVDHDLTIIGEGGVIIRGNGDYALSVSGADVHIEGVTLTWFGRAIDVQGGSVTADNIEITGLQINGSPEVISGAAVRLLDGALNAQDFHVTDLSFDEDAPFEGLFYVDGTSELTLTDFEIADNTIATDGAATGIFFTQGFPIFDLSDGKIANNTLSSATSSSNLTDVTGDWQGVNVVANSVASGTASGTLALVVGEWNASHLKIADNSTVAATHAGVYVYTATATITNSIFSGNSQTGGNYTYGWFMVRGSSLNLTNVSIVANLQTSYIYSGALFYANDWSGNTSISITNTAITENEFGETIPDEGEADILLLSYGAVSLDSNFYHGNSDDSMFYASNNSQVTESEEGADYVDVTAEQTADWDLHLDDGSPLIDAGNADILDADGTQSDIGAFGGPLGVWLE